jgi:hypothetical protein
MNFPIASRGSSVESVELVDEVALVEVVLALVSGGGPLGGGGMEIPIWLNASMMLCIKVSLFPCCDPVPET